MRSTRRLLDRYSPTAIVFLSCAAGAMASASCSSAREEGGEEALVPDASLEASTPLEDAAADGSPPDAAPFDGGLLPVECESPSCAVALVTAQDESFCALLRDGTVACWGANKDGQLGRGDASDDSATPARVVGVSDIVALDHTCAVDKTGAAWCWGTGPYLQGDAGITTERTAVNLDIPPAKKVSANARTACAVVESGVLCWGSNASGQVAADGPFTLAPLHPPRAIAFGPGAPIRDVAVNEVSFIVREDGTSESWGANILLARASSLFPDPIPLPTTLGPITAVDLVADRACVAAGGAAYCWGSEDGPTPRLVRTPEPIVQIATTRTVRESFYPFEILRSARWCAAAASGAVFCLGENGSGQAGDGTKNPAFRPVTVVGLPTRAAQVRTTHDATCILLTSGEIYCFGNNYHGQLGNGVMRKSSLVPVKVSLP
jgi:Regulator of chromosome condensation (RCC1) repeat